MAEEREIKKDKLNSNYDHDILLCFCFHVTDIFTRNNCLTKIKRNCVEFT